MKKFEISNKALTYDEVKYFIENEPKLSVSSEALRKIKKCRDFLENKLNTSEESYYGINTGFGYLYNVKISNDKLEELQNNLIKSHACGLGDLIPLPIIKLMGFLKLQSFCQGHSGVSAELVNAILFLYNQNCYPVIYTHGSLGASGDLAPLSHWSLPIIGLGEVFYNNKIKSMAEIAEKIKYQPLKLKSKEGLALINGTQFMLSYGLNILIEFERLLRWADLISAASLVAFDGNVQPFNPLIQKVRAHTGQVQTAEFMSHVLEGFLSLQSSLQDPYSFRCIPQVHGASKDVWHNALQSFMIEANSVTDNPLLFPDENLIISGGNFHGENLAMHLDFLKIALAEIASISERRSYQLLSGQKNLPLFLTPNSGLQSGFMICQYTAAALVSHNKQLASPASTDTIPTSNNQEDHVSMGGNASIQCWSILKNTKQVLAIELLLAMQALNYKKELTLPKAIKQLFLHYRKSIPFLEKDDIMHLWLEKSQAFIQLNQINNFL